jgi:hypothetical protein
MFSTIYGKDSLLFINNYDPTFNTIQNITVAKFWSYFMGNHKL